MGFKENWQSSSTGKKAGIIGGALLAVLVIVGASVGIAYAVKPKKDNTLDLWLPWAEDKQYAKVMQTVVDEYNATHEGYDIQVTYVNSYDAMGDSFEKEIKAGGIKNLPELYLNYGDVTAKLTSSTDTSYALDLTDKLENLDQVNSNLLAGDNHVIGTGTGTYRIPVAMSAEGMGIDAPLLVYMLHDYKTAGGEVTISGDMISKILDSVDSEQDGKIGSSTDVYTWGTSGSGTGSEANLDAAFDAIPNEDLNAIQELYTPLTSIGTLEPITITDETFNDWKSLVDLGNQLMSIYVAPGDHTSSDQSGRSFIGLDSADNEFHQMASMINGVGLTTANAEMTDVTYDLVTSGTEQYNALETIYNDFFVSGIEGNSLWVAYEKEGLYLPYGSAKLVDHRLAISVGSTAGLSYYYGDNAEQVNAGQVVYTHSPMKFDSSTNTVMVQQGPSIGAVDKYGVVADDAIMDQAVDFIDWFIDPNSKMTTVEGSEDQSVAMYFSQNSNYITATNEVLNPDSDLFGDETALAANGGSYINKYNIGPKVAYDQLKMVQASEATSMTEYSSKDSKTLRSSLKQGAIDAKASYAHDGTVPEFDEFQNNLKHDIDMFGGQYEKTMRESVILNDRRN